MDLNEDSFVGYDTSNLDNWDLEPNIELRKSYDLEKEFSKISILNRKIEKKRSKIKNIIHILDNLSLKN